MKAKELDNIAKIDPYCSVLDSINNLQHLVEFHNKDSTTQAYIDEICAWCEENVGKKYVDWGYVESAKNWLFKNEDDAIQFSLTWQF